MNEEISLKKEKASLCRIKVNKMISSLNSHQDIFIPKYTLTNRNEAKYLSDINQSRKGYSSKASNNKIKNIKKISFQNKTNNTYRITTKYNYLKQPIDFIINHGVLVYQRDFNGDEIINYGIDNEYLKKNRLNMIKNNSSIYQTKSNFAQTENNNMYNKYNKFGLSHQKKLMNSHSKRRMISISDMPSSKTKKNISIIQNRTNNINFKINKNSINNLNSISIKNLVSSNQKTLTDKNTSLGLKTKKILINYKRKKNPNNNKYLIIKKNNLNNILGNEEDSIINNKNIPKKNMNYNNIIPKVNKKSYTIHLKSKIKEVNKKSDKTLIRNNNIIEKEIIYLFEKINKYYLKKYFNLFINRIKDNKKREKGRGKRLNTNKIILENSRLNKKIQNSFDFPNHNRAKSISINRELSSGSLISKGIQKNKNNKNLSLLISKNLRFFSTEKRDKNKELCRDSKSLQKKYEEIYNRKRREMTMTFSNRIKNDSVSVFENNYLSDINKTNSFSNIIDNNSINSINLGVNQKNFKQIFYKDNNNNLNLNLNNSDNRKDKNIYKIKLIKGNNNNKKKIISYRIEKTTEKENKKEKEKKDHKNLSEYRYKTNCNNGFKKNNSIDININNKNRNKYSKEKHSFNIIADSNMDDFKENKKIMKKNELKDKTNVRIKEIYKNNIKEKNILNDIKINKSKIRLHVIKNICTKDKRIFIKIKYLPMVSKPRNIFKYNYNILKIKKIMNFNYIGMRRSKNLIKRNNEFDNKLSLIREEDEKSKFQNSFNSIKYIEEDEFHSSKKNNNNIRMLKDKKNYK